MGQDPDAIRQEIEETRARMGETVDAIGYKADVPSRTKEKVSGKVDSVKEKITGTATGVKESIVGSAGTVKEQVAGTASSVNEATPGTEDIKQGARQAVGLAQSNPLGLAIGAAAVGFIAGLLVPSTNIENEKMGEMSDQLIDQVKSTGQEALEHGKQVAQEVASQAKETAQDAAKEHGQELASSAQGNAEEAKAGMQSAAPSTTY